MLIQKRDKVSCLLRLLWIEFNETVVDRFENWCGVEAATFEVIDQWKTVAPVFSVTVVFVVVDLSRPGELSEAIDKLFRLPVNLLLCF